MAFKTDSSGALLESERIVSSGSEPRIIQDLPEIRSIGALLLTLDGLFANERERWNRFFSTLPESHPLATSLPDEQLVDWVGSGDIPVGRVLDLGCGNGRNSLFLARRGFSVDANDISETALDLTGRNAQKAGVEIQLLPGAFFNLKLEPESYSLVYDLGCLHHVHPHRRPDYIRLVASALPSGGLFALGCFNEKMGSLKSDQEILSDFNMEGGLSFSCDRMFSLFESHFDLLQFRPMRAMNDETDGVGWDHICVSLWRRK